MHARTTFVASTLAAHFACAGLAHADETDPNHDREVEEIAYRADRADDDAIDGSLYAALDVGARVTSPAPRRNDFVAMLTVGGSFGAAVAPRARDDDPGASAPPLEAGETPLAPQIDVVALGRLGTATLRHVRAHASAAVELERLDDLASRARWSALLPELRVRVARVVDEDRAFSPTEYDPNRTTTGNQESFWIEGRAAFRLDRLVFASEEIALERLRLDRQREERRVELEAIAWLRRHARADAIARASVAPPEVVADAELDRAEAALTLDALTGGWFSRAGLGERPAPRSSE